MHGNAKPLLLSFSSLFFFCCHPQPQNQIGFFAYDAMKLLTDVAEFQLVMVTVTAISNEFLFDIGLSDFYQHYCKFVLF